MRKQAQVNTLNEKYSSNDEDTSTTNTADDKAIQTSPYQILFVLNVRESLLMTAMEVIESGDIQAMDAYEQVLNEVNEWVEMHRTKQSTKVTDQQIEGGDKQLHTLMIDRNNRIEKDIQEDIATLA